MSLIGTNSLLSCDSHSSIMPEATNSSFHVEKKNFSP